METRLLYDYGYTSRIGKFADDVFLFQKAECCPLCADDKPKERLVVNVIKARQPLGKKHKMRRWMTLSYHRRIQKKWDRKVQYISRRQRRLMPKPDQQVMQISLPPSIFQKLKELQQ